MHALKQRRVGQTGREADSTEGHLLETDAELSRGDACFAAGQSGPYQVQRILRKRCSSLVRRVDDYNESCGVSGKDVRHTAKCMKKREFSGVWRSEKSDLRRDGLHHGKGFRRAGGHVEFQRRQPRIELLLPDRCISSEELSPLCDMLPAIIKLELTAHNDSVD